MKIVLISLKVVFSNAELLWLSKSRNSSLQQEKYNVVGDIYRETPFYPFSAEAQAQVRFLIKYIDGSNLWSISDLINTSKDFPRKMSFFLSLICNTFPSLFRTRNVFKYSSFKHKLTLYTQARIYSISKRLVKLTWFESFPLQLSGHQEIPPLSFVLRHQL